VTKEEHFNQGMELFAQDKLSDAVAAYQSALKEDPDYADALHALAMTYAHLGKLDEAIDLAKRLIVVTPDEELAYTSLSMFYQQKGLIEEAEHIAAKARTLGWKRELRENQTPRKN
jgi:tetratricopeptide (TPR) repeat protein